MTQTEVYKQIKKELKTCLNSIEEMQNEYETPGNDETPL